MLELAIATRRDLPDLYDEDATNELATEQMPGMIIFGIVYTYAIVLLVILLLRMLMALLTASFNSVAKESVLEWRLQLARHVRTLTPHPHP